MSPDDTTLKMIYNDDEEFFKKCREIWNKVIETIGIDAPHFIRNFVETTLDDNGYEYILLDAEKKQTLLEIKIEMILYLFLHLSLIIYFKHH